MLAAIFMRGVEIGESRHDPLLLYICMVVCHFVCIRHRLLVATLCKIVREIRVTFHPLNYLEFIGTYV